MTSKGSLEGLGHRLKTERFSKGDGTSGKKGDNCGVGFYFSFASSAGNDLLG